MELDSIYQNFECRNTEDTSGPRTLNHKQNEGKDENRRGSRCLVLMTVCLGLICVLLLVIIILQHIFITAERESLVSSNKITAEEFNQIINSLQDNYTDLTQKKLELETRVKDLTVEKDQLKNSFSSLSQKKLELETRVKDLTVEKDQLKNSFRSLSQKKLELESKVTSLSDELLRYFFISNESKSWSESRKYCRDRGADLVIINTEEKQERVWIGLSDIETEGRMIWVDKSTLNRGFWSKDQPNDYNRNEDCVELSPAKDPVNNWFDRPCSEMKKGFCEKN
ncbi:C-type lectin domain family 4 member E-like isoform X2 [Megalobrama amblycephala]|uniref:C-type lectin domain family 4 member E-like isoform X2 n=1 Tax=Megalobrama amblycephala TaxID=75352 RepID=UPI0020140B5F|nr:C-type lectin domain family 4 member E-like isoform X2 [Megalobrama amblycephala]